MYLDLRFAKNLWCNSEYVPVVSIKPRPFLKMDWNI